MKTIAQRNCAPRGFTLIEMVVYIALMGLLMTGVLVCAFDLIQSSQKTGGKTAVQEEGTFALRKIQWAFADMSAAPTLGGSGCTQTISIAKTGYPLNPIEFRRNATNNSIEMREGGAGAYSAITTSNVSASCLKFYAIAAVGAAPAGVTATTTIAGLDFVNTTYVRK
jgi:prepilin-type N-terminal cleavage/methylation domain-containing protein